MNVSSNGIIVFDLNNIVTFSNLVASQFTKLPNGGYNIQDVFALFPNVKMGEIFGKVFSEKQSYRIAEYPTHNYFYEIFLIPLMNDQETLIGGAILLHDISYIKRLEEIKAQFLTVAAHQLRTPLGGMRWSLEMIMEEITDQISNETKQMINQVYESNLMALSIVNDLLNVSKIDSQKTPDNPQPTNVIRIIQKILTSHQSEAKLKSVQYKVNLPPAENFPSIMIDKLKIQQVIDNLVANAIRYNRPNGSMSITVTHDDKNMTISVADTGIGIPEKDLKRIFTKFFRATNAVLNETSGSGLGLYVVKKYVDSWKGKVSISSQEGIGTTITISMPITLSEQNEAREQVVLS